VKIIENRVNCWNSNIIGRMENQTKHIYDQYISYLQVKQHDPQKKLEKHRIIPGHDNGTYISSNVVLCSFEEHTLAHFYR